MAKRTRGHERFRRWFETAGGGNQTVVAERLGVHQATVSKLLAGGRGVSVDLGLRIEAATTDWAEGPILIGEWNEASAAASDSLSESA